MAGSKRRWKSGCRYHVSLIYAVFPLSSEHFLTHNRCKSLVPKLFVNREKVPFKHGNIAPIQNIFLGTSNHKRHDLFVF